VTALSQAWVCGRSLAGIAFSNSAGCLYTYVLYVVSVGVLSGKRFSDGPIPRTGESYRVCVCVIKCDQVREKHFTLRGE